MSIKVVHVVRQYSPSVGGLEDVVRNIVRQQREHHDQVPRIITLNRLFRNADGFLASKAIVDGVSVMRLPFRGTSRYPVCPQVLKHVADADVIHVHGIDFFFDYLALTKPFHKRPLVASTHGGFFHTSFASTIKKVYFNTVTRASSMMYDKIIATSDNDGNIFKKIVNPSKLAVIENGVNVEKYRNQAALTPTRTLIYFGRWSANKGLLETLALFKKIAARQSGWKLIIAGREYDHTAEELSAWLGEHQLTDSVQIIPNPSDRALAELIGQASYFICLSQHEGFGLAAIEAMSAGLTPVLSNIPPFRNLVEQSHSGILLSAQSDEDNVERLLFLHEETQRNFAVGRSNMQQFADRYNWRHIANQYVEVYKNLMSR
ncbi:glycosyltransferase family 4 protein [Glaciimonas immobilis]|uniref:Alpha-1,3-mannosyltransferase n=1 Tax=Glaciimonas immobilis TaxID=728004 RepID=A0A840RTX1_9BURK|nr:glycosyltransferase family 4 protein [Glaciimonas immobilis]KAF3998379.1 glycosyltransferase family 4 protein [Glaciimonas immobilis]MBB5202007.1 alpha-1,3-mannosyltransferase [Glaciimonas immobilis]